MKQSTEHMTPKKQKAATDAMRLKKAATRVNDCQPLHTIKPVSNKANKDVRGKEVFVPRERKPNEALGPLDDLWQRGIYKTGDGDAPLVIRPGALDFKKWPSKGLST